MICTEIFNLVFFGQESFGAEFFVVGYGEAVGFVSDFLQEAEA